jgi:hypothetical protein
MFGCGHKIRVFVNAQPVHPAQANLPCFALGLSQDALSVIPENGTRVEIYNFTGACMGSFDNVNATKAFLSGNFTISDTGL